MAPLEPRQALLPLLRKTLGKLTLRFSGEMAIHEDALQRERWNSPVVELCMCALLVPSFVALMDAEGDMAYFHRAIFMLMSMLATLATSLRLCTHMDGLQSKRYFEWAVACTAAGGVCLHAVTAIRDRTEPPCGCIRFQFGPVAHSTLEIVSIIVSHVLHFSTPVKLLVAASLPVFAIISPAFPFGLEPELKLLVMAMLAGFAFGYALEYLLCSNFLTLRQARDAAEAQTRADSRLNHVIKGLCGGAAGMLQGVKVELSLQGIHTDITDSLDEVRLQLAQLHPHSLSFRSPRCSAYSPRHAHRYDECWNRPLNGCTNASSSYSLNAVNILQPRCSATCEKGCRLNLAQTACMKGSRMFASTSMWRSS